MMPFSVFSSVPGRDSHIVTVDPAYLLKAIQHDASTGVRKDSLLKLYNNTELPIQRVNTHPGNIMTWYGAPDNREKALETYAVLSFSTSSLSKTGCAILAGIIAYQQDVYTISPTEDGYLELIHNSRNEYHNPIRPYSDPHNHPRDDDPERKEEINREEWNRSTALIRIVAAYTTRAKLLAGGTVNMEVLLRLIEERANQIFMNSDINAKVELIPREMPNLTDNLLEIMDKLGFDKGPKTDQALIQEFSDLLEKQNADLIAAIPSRPLSADTARAGSGPRPPNRSHLTFLNRVFVVPLLPEAGPSHNPLSLFVSCAFSHELGHLLGASHQRSVDQLRDNIYSHIRGYINEEGFYCTVMCYGGDLFYTVPAYSSPQIRYRGKPLGVPADNPLGADAAAFLRLSTKVVSTYKKSFDAKDAIDLAVSVSPDIGGTVIVSSLGPYKLGDRVEFRALARHEGERGYEFDHWYLAGKSLGNANPLILTMEQSLSGQTVIALFKLRANLPCQLRIDQIDPEIGKVVLVPSRANPQLEEGHYNYGDKVTAHFQYNNDSDQIYSVRGWKVDAPEYTSGSYKEAYIEMFKDIKISPMVARRDCKINIKAVPQEKIDFVELVLVDSPYGVAELALEPREHILRYGVPIGSWCALYWRGAFLDHYVVDGKPYERTPLLTVQAKSSTMNIVAYFKGFEDAHEVNISAESHTKNIHPLFEVEGKKGFVQFEGLSFKFSKGTRIYLYLENRISVDGQELDLGQVSAGSTIIDQYLTKGNYRVIEIDVQGDTKIDLTYRPAK